MDIEIYRKFFWSIAKPQRSGKVFSNCESVPPIDGDTVTNRYPPQSGHEGLSEMLTPEAVKGTKRISTPSLNMELLKKLRTPIQSPDMAEAVSSEGANRIRTLDDKRIATRLDDDDEKGVAKMVTPEADRATRAEGGEGQQRYIRQQGESLKNYLHRTRTDIFLFLREALKPTDLTPAQEMKIVEELREAYQVMWQGQRVPRNGKYLIKSECERVISALDGAITKPKYQTQ